MKEHKVYEWYSHNVTIRIPQKDICPPILAAMGMGGCSMTTPIYIVEEENDGEQRSNNPDQTT